MAPATHSVTAALPNNIRSDTDSLLVIHDISRPFYKSRWLERATIAYGEVRPFLNCSME